MARPKLEIPANQVLMYARLGAFDTEIADFFGCSAATIRRRFKAELAKGRAEERLWLRGQQRKLADKLNPAILIFLGKNVLGQSDVPKETQSKMPALPTLKLVPITSPNTAAAGNNTG